jgi:hypothetical protein
LCNLVVALIVRARQPRRSVLDVKTPKSFGCVMVRYISNMDRMFVTSWFNPDNGSRNLEIDPNKIQVVQP